MENEIMPYARQCRDYLARFHEVLESIENEYCAYRECLKISCQEFHQATEAVNAELEHKIERTKNQTACEEELQATLQSELATLKELAHIQQEKLASLKTMEHLTQTRASPQIKLLRDYIKRCIESTEAMQTEIQLYSERLGLTIQMSEQGTTFCFVGIRPENPKQEHWVTLSIDAKERYVLETCQPPLDQVLGWVMELNIKNNLTHFLKRVREAFVQRYR